ncbi:MAG: response regulator [Alphaproteobacteria bacterium]|nr:response regulator [Alphaproteobacteria bacterium]
MDQNTPPFTDALEGLRQKYLTQLKERKQQLDNLLIACSKDKLEDEDRTSMREIAHRLSGSGKTYGFSSISETASALEFALASDTQASSDILSTLIKALIEACGNALKLQVISREMEVSISEQINAKALPSKQTILSVDDDEDICDLLVKIFHNDAEVLVASTGEKALEIIKERKPDLVLLDDRMPGLSGIQLLEKLKQDNLSPATSVVMLTATKRSPEVTKAMSFGALDYIIKPFDVNKLHSRVMTILSRLGTTILVVDDDENIGDLLAAKFGLHGVRVLLAYNGDEALRIARTRRPNLIILDRMLPGMDGFHVFKQIKREKDIRNIPVVFITAKRREGDVIEGLKSGAADYIAKPFIVEEVIARCMRILGLKMAS